MVQRKPVQSQIAIAKAPTSPTPLPPNRPPPVIPEPLFARPRGTIEQDDSDSDSDFDWDACDEEEPTISTSEPILASGPGAPNVQNVTEATPLQVQTTGWSTESQPSNNPIDPTRSPSSPQQQFDQARARNTNPFLRNDVNKQTNIFPPPNRNVWDDENRPAQGASGSKGALRPPMIEREYSVLPEVTLNQETEAFRSSKTIAREDVVSTSAVATAVIDSGQAMSPKYELAAEPIQRVITQAASTADLETPQANAKKQRNEFYQIKHIRWFDGVSKENPRHSPILIQNANGPCPLLALVNCLVLTTPPNLQTALVEALRLREQVSLGLLLDAVFDELTSERRCSSTNQLPDVAELYSFLITLHTGMNVNPRFVHGTNLKKVPSGVEDTSPGSFEETKEMKLYGTFSIPLIHGWLPHRNETAFEAFDRAAQTYEDTQNLQFLEYDLEEKLGSDQLTSEEQQLLNDLKVIKQFLFYWPTQLTAHGLDVIDRFLQPGSMCILFRNDHFSTVLKEPFSNRLMTLVTDAGYSTHDEIVWESLVDINGANSEFCSGDFRSVSHHDERGVTQEISSYDDDSWTTVENKHGRSRHQTATSKVAGKRPASPQRLKIPSQGVSLEKKQEATQPGSSVDFDLPDRSQRGRSASMQEDHDLALALQLQEEEEERERNAAAARRARENDLSEEFLSREASRQGQAPVPRQGQGQGPVSIPVRRSGQSQNNPTPAPVRTTASDAVDVAPPPYELAASSVAFHPPRNHPASEHAPRSPLTSSTQTASAYGTTSGQPFRPGAGTGATSQRRMSARQSLVDQQSSAYAASLASNRRPRIDPGLTPVYAERDRDDRCRIM